MSVSGGQGSGFSQFGYNLDIQLLDLVSFGSRNVSSLDEVVSHYSSRLRCVYYVKSGSFSKTSVQEFPFFIYLFIG